MMVHRGIRLVFWVILSFLLSSAVCIMLYFLNNKYTDPAPQAENGYLDLTQETEETYPLRFLRDGWAFYPDALLGPEDFNDGAPKEYMVYTSIGDFTRFDRMGTRETPFGCGTWVLDLWLPETGDYALELPEIFSAYRFYVNDRLVLQTGDPDPETYTPKTQIRTVHLNDSYGGWFPELGIQILVVFIFCALAADILRAYSFHQSFAESYRQLSRQLAIQKAHYQELTSQIEETVRIRHDQRHHLTVISTLLEEGRLSQAQKYLSEYQSRLHFKERTVLCRCLMVDAILQYYKKLCEQNHIHFTVQAELPPELPFSNKIHTVNGKYLSGKHDGTGIGTESVRAVVKRLDGQIRFQTLSDHFQVSVILPAEQKIL